MKKIMLFATVVFTLTFVSCKLNDGYSEYTPEIVFYTPVILNSDSSVYLKSTSELGVVRLDSIHVGDTIRIKIGMNGYANQLTQFNYSVNDSTAIKTIFPDSAKTLFKSMNYKTREFNFNSNYAIVILPLDLVALKASDSIVYKFGVTSDVMKVPNADAISLKTKIKPKQVLE
jgi:hypothetical protein